MCGITGFWNLKKNSSHRTLENIINNMSDVLKNRGPDDKGSWIDSKNNISFGHRRLSIIELSKLGRQPMESKNKRYVIVFNGEIYNFLDIKKELIENKVKFFSNSDTEVLVEAIAYWGINKTLEKISGMFAFSLWDKKNKQLY